MNDHDDKEAEMAESTSSKGSKQQGKQGRKVGEAARAERSGEPRTIEFEGLELTLPAAVPFRVLRYMRGAEVDAVGALEAIVGAEQMERVWEADLDVEQGGQLVERILDELGTSPGKSAASRTS